MNDELSDEQELILDDMIAAFIAKIDLATEEMRQRIIVDQEEWEIRQLELWWRS